MQPQFKLLQIITLALPAGIILFLIVTFLINQQELVWLPVNEQNSVLNYIAFGLAAIFFLLSNMIFQKFISSIDGSLPVSEKLSKYVQAYIVRFALLEGAGLFNVVVLLLTGVLLNALIAAAIILFMLAARPQRQKTIDDLKVYYPDTLE